MGSSIAWFSTCCVKRPVRPLFPDCLFLVTMLTLMLMLSSKIKLSYTIIIQTSKTFVADFFMIKFFTLFLFFECSHFSLQMKFFEKLKTSQSMFLHNTIYFLIGYAQMKVTLFIFVNNWVIRENKSFLILELCSRVTCCVQIKLQYFFRKYIFICTIYTLLMQLISAILYDTC